MIKRVIAFWDEREAPTALALIRILVGVVLLWDLAVVGLLRLPIWLWAPREAGGVSPVDPPVLYDLLGETAGAAIVIYALLLITILGFTLGFFTRTSALVFVFVSAQTALMNDYSDRGIDRALRIVILILGFSEAGRAWSLDARRKTGRWRGDGALVPAWPRYLIFAQLVVMYCSAGFSKGGTRWHPWGGFAALYVIMRDPIFAIADFAWVAHPIPYFFTQVGTGTTLFWEMTIPVVLLAAYYRRTADRSGRLRGLFNRLPIRTAYVLVGAGFHVGLMVTVRIGIFPFAMLAFYPAFYRPGELEEIGEKLRARVTGWVSAVRT